MPSCLSLNDAVLVPAISVSLGQTHAELMRPFSFEIWRSLHSYMHPSCKSIGKSGDSCSLVGSAASNDSIVVC